jgi:hypothetical protein
VHTTPAVPQDAGERPLVTKSYLDLRVIVEAMAIKNLGARGVLCAEAED